MTSPDTKNTSWINKFLGRGSEGAELFAVLAVALVFCESMVIMGTWDPLYLSQIGFDWYTPKVVTLIVVATLCCLVVIFPSFLTRFLADCCVAAKSWKAEVAAIIVAAREGLHRFVARAAHLFAPLIACFIDSVCAAGRAQLTDFLHALFLFHIRFDARLTARPRFAPC